MSMGDAPRGDIDQLPLIAQRIEDEKKSKAGAKLLAQTNGDFPAGLRGGDSDGDLSDDGMENAMKLPDAYLDKAPKVKILTGDAVWESPTKTTERYLAKPNRRQSVAYQPHDTKEESGNHRN